MRGLLLSCLLAATAQAETIHDAELGYAFTVPDGFTRGEAPNAKVRYAFYRGEPGHPGYAMIALQEMDGVIGREPIHRAAFERGVRSSSAGTQGSDLRFAYHHTRWRDFDLDLAEFHVHAGDADIAAFATQVPLAPQALNLMITGVTGDEARLRADLERVLASIDGKSNWLSDAERGERLGFLVGLLVTIPLAIWIPVWIRRRRARRG